MFIYAVSRIVARMQQHFFDRKKADGAQSAPSNQLNKLVFIPEVQVTLHV